MVELFSTPDTHFFSIKSLFRKWRHKWTIFLTCLSYIPTFTPPHDRILTGTLL